MSGIGSWIIGGLLGLFALIGLFAASGAVDDIFYYGGFGVFAVCVGGIFVLINNAFNRVEAAKSQHSNAEG